MSFNIEKLLNNIKVEYKKKDDVHKNSPCIKYELKHCFFNKEEHIKNDACIFQYKNGALSYKCLHDSCIDKKWKDVRGRIESEYKIDIKKYWSKYGGKKTEDIPLQFETFHEICEKPVERKSIINGFIDEGDQTIISGSGGVGKSMYIFYLAYFLAKFKKAEYQKSNLQKSLKKNTLFKKFPIPKQRASMFIQSENNRNQINIRLNKMTGEYPENKEALKRIVTPVINDDVLTTGKTFQDEKFQKWVIDLIHKIENKKGFKLDLLFIDPLISYISRDENDAASMRKDLDGITQIAHTAKITPVVIHHNQKGGKMYRGSSAIADWTRNMISLISEENSSDKSNDENDSENTSVKCIKVEHVKCNNFQMFNPFNIRRKKDNTFELVEGVISPEAAEQGELIRKALEHLDGRTNSLNKLAKIYAELSGCSLSTAKRHIPKTVDKGFINRIEIDDNKKNGKKKRKRFVYILKNERETSEKDEDDQT